MELAGQSSHAIVGTVEHTQVQVRLSWNRFAGLCRCTVIQPPPLGSTDEVTTAGFEPTTS